MGIETGIMLAVGIGSAVSAGGAYMNYQGQRKQAAAQEQAIALQQQIEEQRQKQLNLDATRRKREIIRQSIAARAQALATVAAQNAQSGTALPSAYAGISGRSNVNLLGVEQNQEIGNSMFGLNRGLLGAYREGAAGQSMSATGQGLTSLGGMILSNATTIGRVGGTAFGGYGGGGYSTYGGTVSAMGRGPIY